MKTVEKTTDGTFILRIEDDKGKAKSAETFHPEKMDKPDVVGNILQTEVKGWGAVRRAKLSLLAYVMRDPRLEGYKGKGDVVAGKYSKEFKASMKQAELAYLKSMVDKKLLKLDAAEVKEHGEDHAFQSVASIILDDKNYTGVRAVVMKYWSFVNSAPSMDDVLVPVPIMQAEIEKVLKKHQVQPDTSYAGKINAIKDDMDKETSFPMDQLPNAIAAAKLLLASLEGIAEHAKQVADDVAAQAAHVVAQAQANKQVKEQAALQK